MNILLSFMFPRLVKRVAASGELSSFPHLCLFPPPTPAFWLIFFGNLWSLFKRLINMNNNITIINIVMGWSGGTQLLVPVIARPHAWEVRGPTLPIVSLPSAAPSIHCSERTFSLGPLGPLGPKAWATAGELRAQGQAPGSYVTELRCLPMAHSHWPAQASR